jgi:hypothetical protein
MFRKSFTGLVAFGICAALMQPPSAHAAEQTGLVVKHITQGDGGIYVGFTVRPADCTGDFRQAHAFLSKQSADFTDIYAALATAKATGVPVRIVYTDAGDCLTGPGLLQINGIGG